MSDISHAHMTKRWFALCAENRYSFQGSQFPIYSPYERVLELFLGEETVPVVVVKLDHNLEPEIGPDQISTGDQSLLEELRGEDEEIALALGYRELSFWVSMFHRHTCPKPANAEYVGQSACPEMFYAILLLLESKGICVNSKDEFMRLCNGDANFKDIVDLHLLELDELSKKFGLALFGIQSQDPDEFEVDMERHLANLGKGRSTQPEAEVVVDVESRRALCDFLVAEIDAVCPELCLLENIEQMAVARP